MNKEEFVQRMETELAGLSERIQEIGSAGSRFEGGYDDIRHAAIDLEDQLEAARRRILDVAGSDDHEWTARQGDIQAAVEDLRRDLQVALARHGAPAHDPRQR